MNTEIPLGAVLILIVVFSSITALFADDAGTKHGFKQGAICQRAIGQLATSADTLDFYRMQTDRCIEFLERRNK
jgi:hypothetical protein